MQERVITQLIRLIAHSKRLQAVLHVVILFLLTATGTFGGLILIDTVWRWNWQWFSTIGTVVMLLSIGAMVYSGLARDRYEKWLQVEEFKAASRAEMARRGRRGQRRVLIEN